MLSVNNRGQEQEKSYIDVTIICHCREGDGDSDRLPSATVRESVMQMAAECRLRCFDTLRYFPTIFA